MEAVVWHLLSPRSGRPGHPQHEIDGRSHQNETHLKKSANSCAVSNTEEEGLDGYLQYFLHERKA